MVLRSGSPSNRRLTASLVTWYMIYQAVDEGKHFIIGKGERVPHDGQAVVNSEAELGAGETKQLKSVLQSPT